MHPIRATSLWGAGTCSLSELARARRCLEQAWASGYRTPETAYALGLTLGRLFQQENHKTQQIASRQEREVRRRQLQKELRDPAHRYLKASQGAEMVAPEYLKALLAYYEEDYPVALAQARQAFERVGWLYEAKVLEGDVQRARDWGIARQGDYENLAERLGNAEKAYRTVLEIAQSNIHIYNRLLSLLVYRLSMAILYSGDVKPEYYQLPLEVGQVASRVDPENATIMAELAAAHVHWAEYQLRKGQDPSGFLSAAQRLSEQALRLTRDDPDILQRLGEIEWEHS